MNNQKCLKNKINIIKPKLPIINYDKKIKILIDKKNEDTKKYIDLYYDKDFMNKYFK